LPVQEPQSYSTLDLSIDGCGVTDHDDTRSKRVGLGGYLGDFTTLSTPASYDPWRVLIEASLRNISCSESDICPWVSMSEQS